MPTTPSWEAARNGLPGDLDATNHAAQINQMLGTHGITPIYEGAQLVTPAGGANFTWLSYGTATDFDQPFTMPGGHTTIGRITIPINPVGNGADLFVGLYPDNGSGSPNTNNLLAGTTIPATWINQLAAPTGLANGGPLAAAAANTLNMTGGVTRVIWAPPTSGPYNTINTATPLASGNYLIFAGGFSPIAGYSTSVYTVQFEAPGVISSPTPQPSLPAATNQGGLAATAGGFLVYAGGNDATAATSAVWTASWDQSTGSIGSWGAQASLPTANTFATMTAYGNNVYFLGGGTSSTASSNVYWATVNNGQISAWNTGPSLPITLRKAFAAAIDGWLIIAGGEYDTAGDLSAAVYYAKIQPDGALGAWRTGPALPQPWAVSFAGFDFAVTDSALVVLGGVVSGVPTAEVAVLTVTANGLSDHWVSSNWTSALNWQGAAWPLGDGQWQAVAINTTNQYYEYTTLVPTPLVSVPLPATGLTGGATYHVVLQQGPSADSSSYLQYGINNAAMPTDSKKSVRHSGTWTTAQTGYSMPLAVYDNTVGGPILHTWQDPTSTGSTVNSNIAARTSTTVYNTYNLPYGLCEATALPNDPLNSNPTFTTGTSPWTAHNCTFTQSNTQTHGGYPFSGLLTPNGTSATVNVTSELVPVTTLLESPAWYELNGWLYSPTGWSNVSLSVDWYDPSRTYITTNNTTTSLAAATWTNLANFYRVPAGAAFAAINVIEGSTPAAGNTLFLSYVTIAMAPEYAKTLAPVSQITYPANAPYPPIGVNQLA